jgi:predicted nucleotidyltransferase
MKKKITEQIRVLENKHNVRVIYACETGSRAWGFPSPDSDYDVRMIYMHEPDWYISLGDKKDTIEFMAADGELDITGWDIKKCLKLMWKSNGALLERLQSPIIYTETQAVGALLKQYSEKCFSPIATMYHYLGMAKNSFADVEGKELIKLKKLFYALRATLACKWIIEKKSVPPIIFGTMVNELNFNATLKARIVELIALKLTKNEDYMHNSEIELNTFISTELQKSTDIFSSLKGRAENEIDLDVLLLKIIKNY